MSMLTRLKEAVGLIEIDPFLIATEEMPMTAQLIEELFMSLPDELQIVEEEEAKWDKEFERPNGQEV